MKYIIEKETERDVKENEELVSLTECLFIETKQNKIKENNVSENELPLKSKNLNKLPVIYLKDNDITDVDTALYTNLNNNTQNSESILQDYISSQIVSTHDNCFNKENNIGNEESLIFINEEAITESKNEAECSQSILQDHTYCQNFCDNVNNQDHYFDNNNDVESECVSEKVNSCAKIINNEENEVNSQSILQNISEIITIGNNSKDKDNNISNSQGQIEQNSSRILNFNITMQTISQDKYVLDKKENKKQSNTTKVNCKQNKKQRIKTVENNNEAIKKRTRRPKSEANKNTVENELLWLKEIKYVREINKKEYCTNNLVSEQFWTDTSLFPDLTEDDFSMS